MKATILLATILAGLIIGMASAHRASVEPLPMSEVADGIFVYQGEHLDQTTASSAGIANIGFIVGGQAIAVIDTGGRGHEGQRLLAAIRTVSELPIRYVINTHVHPDHVFGNSAFIQEPGVMFVGHHKLPRALAARGGFYLDALTGELGAAAAGTEIVQPDLLVESELTLDLGDRSLHLTAHPAAHTDNDLTVFDALTKTFWLSDLLFIDRTPVVDGSLLGWQRVMQGLAAIEAERVVPGHGPVSAEWPDALQDQARYLAVITEGLRKIIDEEGTINQALETVGVGERDHWLLFDHYNARNVTTGFTELEWE